MQEIRLDPTRAEQQRRFWEEMVAQHPQGLYGIIQQFYQGQDSQAIEAAMDADVPEGAEVMRRIKLGRNSPCPCGSGKKFKKCCIYKAKQV